MAKAAITTSTTTGCAKAALDNPCHNLLELLPLEILLGQNSFGPRTAMKNIFRVNRTGKRIMTPMATAEAL